MKIFNPSVFKISDKIKFKKIIVNDRKFVVVDNFYENLNLVCNEIKKLPYVYLGGQWKQYQNVYYKDFRQSYSSNMVGTILPYLTDDNFHDKLTETLGHQKDDLQLSDDLLVNCWKKLANEDLFKNNYYSIHSDNSIYKHNHDIIKQYAIVIYLNKKYCKDDGTNFYTLKNEVSDNNIFTNKQDIDVFYFHKANPNSAIIYESSILHSQSVSTSNLFLNHFRKTQVMWIYVFDTENNKRCLYY